MTTLLPGNLPQFTPTVSHYHLARGALVSMFIYGKSLIQPTRGISFNMVKDEPGQSWT